MQRRHYLFIFVVFMLMEISYVAFPLAGHGQIIDQEANWDIIVKVSRLDETLTVIDDLVGVKAGEPSPTAMIRNMIQGTDWIDTSRAVVLGVRVKEPSPETLVMIPFQRPNDTFKEMYQAVSRPDYYLISFPPGQQVPFSTQGETLLVAESGKKVEKTVSVEISINKLLKDGESQIQQALMNINPAGQDKIAGIKDEDVKEMASNLIETMKEVDILRFELDLTPETLGFGMQIQAVDGTRLEKLFSSATRTTFLNAYNPKQQINFKVGRFNMEGMVKLFEENLGAVYRKMGINFSELTAITKYFTGEMAGGISYDKTGAILESISLIDSFQKPQEFLETVYLPWMEQYGEISRQMIENQTGENIGPIFERMPDSQVSGHKVVGINMRIPYSPMGPGTGSEQGLPMVSYNIRMTVLDNFFITAPDDQQIEALIKTVRGLGEAPLEGPLMRFEVDVAQYSKALKDMIPGLSAPGPIPDMGKLLFTGDMEDGLLMAGSTISIDNIKNMAAYFKNLSTEAQPAQTGIALSTTPAPKTSVQKSRVPPKPEPEISHPRIPPKRPVKKDFTYFMNKGNLLSAYENDKTAIKYFQRAIKLNPDRSSAYFNMGVSYGELEQYDKALQAINQAIQMEPDRALYYYGRGRVYLLSGQKDKALMDIQWAAELGNQDAKDYMEKKNQSAIQ